MKKQQKINKAAHRAKVIRSLYPHIILWIGIAIIIFPIYFIFSASSHTNADIQAAPMPLSIGSHLIENYRQAILHGTQNMGTPVSIMLKNSLIMALGISIGKILISLLAAFAIVFFDFPLRGFCFWSIFITLMLPVEVRIMPTYKVIADLGLLNSYAGLILPMIVSATAVFLFRQFFMSVPREIAEASQIDGATPMQFFRHILAPMTRTPIASMFVIQFIYGWNQYLWPLLITTKPEFYTLLIGINRMMSGADVQIEWQIVMATTMLAMLPPVIVVVLMQKQFISGMTETEK
ncbi:MAG: L-arabinose transport system permease protein AraQ [Spirochaetes bacterium ADurb.Bin110]|jgi:sn-glycerol 3-phosphate transport system permease protein|nr:sn-glycerol-3-phosphate ABC transporter permease UgpE [Treponema sp.]OQB97629.1 MAG: L-arabinose transport system permease protein AraQ [Spirochaetes bacterium ADurb.Bin110]HOI99150.1 sn-glycerol-3-phosphate ABC transporter permease UgpE [Rectinema sp.]HPN03552.1 sn-glycerol-3-phosphate ABC transporter permease UgpE [Rectinema sp.]HQQ32221.1 sn-glycerol-3-phosphate ABC transporter permease UgpE [Rectinema sp.]